MQCAEAYETESEHEKHVQGFLPPDFSTQQLHRVGLPTL